MPELIEARKLHPGHVLRQPLFSRQGIKLLPAGAQLTVAIVKALHDSGEPLFVAADDVQEIAQARLVRPRLPARLGQRATETLITRGGAAALPVGEETEQHHDDAYALGSFAPADETPAIPPAASPASGAVRQTDFPHRPWAVRHDALNRVRAAMLRIADELIAQKSHRWGTLPRTINVGVEPVAVSTENLPGWFDTRQLADLRAERVETHRRLLANLVAGVPAPLGPIVETVEELVALYARYPRRFAELALNTPWRPDYLPDHAFAVSVLSVAIAARLRWPRWEVVNAGLAGLLADAGMTSVPREIRAAGRPLDDTEINRVRRHPAIGVVMLEAINGLPEVVALALYEHHERENASGYPLALPGRKIHPIAKVIAAADTFAALAAPRPHRANLLPSVAMEQTIAQVSAGALDRPAVRALVECCGLYPVSSFVRLSDGSIARVIGAHESLVDRPIVQRHANGRPGDVIDLSTLAPGDLSILEAVAAPS